LPRPPAGQPALEKGEDQSLKKRPVFFVIWDVEEDGLAETDRS
jgi:hypothetical protein